MTIYAIFLCMQMGCRPVAPPSYVDGAYIPAKIYGSLADCQLAMLQWYGGGWQGKHPKLDSQGRLLFNPPQASIWYECLSRRIEVWQHR